MKYSFTLSQTEASEASFRMNDALRKRIKALARRVAAQEIPELRTLELGIVLMTDDELLDLNISSLGHDWYTDILTFEIERETGSDGVHLEAELYFSVDRAKENALLAHVTQEQEILLLTIHGVLHLGGYDDHEPLDKARMAERERFFLDLVYGEN